MKSGQPQSRRRRVLWVLGGLLAVYTVLGFLVAPPVIKTQLERRASALLGRTVTVRKVQVNPYAVSVTIEGLDVRLQDGTGSFLGWDRLYVDADPLASITGTLTAGAIELDGFHVTAGIRPDGSFSFADIIEKLNAATPAAASSPSAKPPPAMKVGGLKVSGARVDFLDGSRPRPFRTTLGPVSFGLTEFHTTGARGAPYHFEAVTEAGERLNWTGTLSAVPLASTGELRLENILLPKYSPYYADRVPADLEGGKLTVSGKYEAKLDGNTQLMKLAGGVVQVRELKLVDRTSRELVLELPSLDVTRIDADAMALKAAIGSVAVTGGRIRVRREADGSINLLKLLVPPAGQNVGGALRPDENGAENQSGHKAPPTPNPVAARLPDVVIGEVTVKDFSAEVSDLAAPRSAQLGLTAIQLSLKNVTLADGAEMPLQLAFGWSPAGSVKVTGAVALKPELKATLQTDVAGLSLLPLSPYVEQFVNARITQGTVSTTGAVTLAMTGDVPAISFDGGVDLDKFGLVDEAQNEELAGFGSVALRSLKAATAPRLTLDLAEVAVAAPYARVRMGKDGLLNLVTLAKKEVVPQSAGSNVGGALRPDSASDAEQSGHKAPPTSEPRTRPESAPLPRITVGKVVITDGDFSFSDATIEPNVRLAVTGFGGTIAGLSSENLARAGVDLKATVNGSGVAAITGQLDPLGVRKFVDLKVDCRNVDLLPLSAYSGKYAGFALARGQLNLDVKAKLDDKQLDAGNVVTLNQFTFGPAVASPDATKLPVRLGVALLKDTSGQIVIDVPISGNLDDPSLHIGRVVGRVIVNLLTKAAASPFALLGSMFGGGGEELAFQEFAPGASELLPAEAAKLATMLKALANRPGLSLGIEGGYDGPADTHALKQRKLATLVRGRIWEERRAADPNIAPPDRLEIPPEAHAAMVRKLFDEKFPPGTEFGAPLPPAPVVAVAPPAPKKGFIRRVVDVVTFSSEPAAAPKPGEEAKPAAPVAGAGGGPSLDEMSGRLAEAMVVTDDDLRALADARAVRVRDYFLNEGKIPVERLFLAQGGAAAKSNQGPRVFLTLQ